MKSIPTLLASAAVALVLTASAQAQGSGTMPDFKDATWFNSPPLTVQDLEDHAVLVEVFRTW